MDCSVSLEGVHLRYPVVTSGKQQSLLGNVARNATFGLIRRDNAGLRIVHALRGINLKLERGARLGVVGRNGSGKSTMLKAIAGLLHPSSGRVNVKGRMNSILTLGAGLDPEKTGRENVQMILNLFGVERSQIVEMSRDIEEFIELGQFFDMPVRTYSSGMSIRLSFGLVTAIDGEILIIDEVLGAGDGHFMDRAVERINRKADEAAILVFASHSRAAMENFCTHAVWMHAGQIVAGGPLGEVMDAYEALGEEAPKPSADMMLSF